MVNYIIPILPVDSRYTSDWFSYVHGSETIKENFTPLGAKAEYHKPLIAGDAFLPIEEYINHKLECLHELLDVKQGTGSAYTSTDNFIHLDGLYSLIGSIDDLYLRRAVGMPNNLPTHYVLYHSGLWDENDALTKSEEARSLALGQVYDIIRENVIPIFATLEHRDMCYRYLEKAIGLSSASAMIEKAKVIPFPVDVIDNYCGTGKSPDLVVGYVSRQCDEKGSTVIHELKDSYNLEIKLPRSGEDNMHMMNRPEYFAWLRSIDIVVLPSVQETYGMVCLEALALCKTVVICKEDKGYKVLKKHRGKGLGSLIELDNWGQLPDLLKQNSKISGWGQFTNDLLLAISNTQKK